MWRVTASVEWIDADTCVTHLAARDLPQQTVPYLMEWALALELRCTIEDLAARGWEAHPEGPEYVEPDGVWALDWVRETPAGSVDADWDEHFRKDG
jgi:hypothetical protein